MQFYDYISRSGLYGVKKCFFHCIFDCFFRLEIGYLNMNWEKKLSEVKIHGVLSFFVQTNSFKNERIVIIEKDVNFVGELSSSANFKDNFILIMD